MKMIPDYSFVPMDKLSVDDLNSRLCSTCDVCGKPRSKPGGHPKCAKIRQAVYRGNR